MNTKILPPCLLFTIIFFLCIGTLPVFGQTGTSAVSGVVADEQGRLITEAKIRLVNDENGFSRTLSTDDAGNFKFMSIPPGTYRLDVEIAGFKKYMQSGINAPVDKTIQINITMQVGDINETVSISTEAITSAVNRRDGSIGNNFQSLQIVQLPTDLRNAASLLNLQPGVSREGYVNGARGDQNNFILDGIDINDQQSGVDLIGNNGAFNTVLRISTEALEEFRVTTLNPNSSEGRSSGAQISLSTKTGTNNFRGSVFDFYRPTFASANTFINNRAAVKREALDRNIFGGTIGGPFVKNKTFFFYSFEGVRQPHAKTSVLRIVPLAGLGRGDLKLRTTSDGVLALTRSQLEGIYSQAGLNPVALAIFSSAALRYEANDFSSGAGDNQNTAGYRFNAPTNSSFNTHIIRFDYRLSDNKILFFRGNKQFDVITGPSAFPDAPSPQIWQHNTGFAIGYNWAIDSNRLNVFRYGLTRQSQTVGGDATENAVSFALIFSPLSYSYSQSRITPIHNFTNDSTWIIRNHTLQFGGNARLIRNKREDLSPAFDSAIVNPSFYQNSGQSLLTPLINSGFNNIDTANVSNQAAVAALIGRLSQYAAHYNYDLAGRVLPVGTPVKRNFAVEEYEAYFQDLWEIRRGLNLNLGLRYALSRPVYETEGYQIRPTLPLGQFFQKRLAGMLSGQPYNELLEFELAGPKNNAPGFYSLDKNNFQPRISVAWSPNLKKGILSGIFGSKNQSVLRGGFGITNDHFGQQLAVTFDNLSTLGFTTSSTISPNVYNATDNLGPRFTGFGQQINNLPGIAPLADRFRTPADQSQRIESSLDSTLVTPVSYSWNVTYGRKLAGNLYIEFSYMGRAARHLLVERDVAAFNNLRDPRSGMDWYTAAGRIYDLYYAGANVNTVQPIPYFENLFPGLGAMLPQIFGLPAQPTTTRAVYSLNQNISSGDWTLLQLLLDDDFSGGHAWSNLFIHPQYAAFSAYSTIGKSDYHGGSVSIHERLTSGFTLDFNYTLSRSMDDASGLQSSGAYGAAFLLNPILQQDSYADSDFDERHVVNASAIWQLPFGRGKTFLKNENKFIETMISGWQLAGIYRWNTGQPFNAPVDLSGWATNWQVRSKFVLIHPITTSYFRGGNGKNANIFGNIDDLIAAVRPPRPGETGSRNVFRSAGFSVFDMSLSKTFRLPWKENHRLQFRWEAFNIFNYQYLSGIRTIAMIPAKPPSPSNPNGSPASIFSGSGEFTSIRGNARRMQFGLRYSF